MGQVSIKGQTAFVTGASSGIGKACAEELANLGVNLILTARRLDRLKQISAEFSRNYGVDVTYFELDVRKKEHVDSIAQQILEKNIKIDILINNAGLALSSDKIQDADVSNWETMIDTNLKGLLYVTKAFINSMIERNKGHIVNIGSIAGHGCYVSGNVYCATKHAVRAISRSLRLDLLGTRLRVSEIDPGAVETEFSEVRWKDTEKAKQFYQDFEPLVASDIADAVAYCLTRPSHVNISEIVIHPQAQAFLTEIHREAK